MKPSIILSTIKARFTAHLDDNLHRAMYLVGLPGGGKTQIVAQAARELGVGFRAIHAPLMLPEDYGMPIVNAKRDGVTFVVPSEKFPIVGADCPDTGLLLIDEAPQADNSGQKILANLVQEREIHGKKLKPGWMIVVTGNPTTARAGANRLLSHFSDRMTAYAFEIDLDDWCVWALDNRVKPEVIAFIRFRSDLLCDFDPQRDKNATPRGWAEGVSASLGIVPPDAEYDSFKGDVGEGAAAEFLAFLKIFRKLPNPDAVLMNPEKAEVPTDMATLYAISSAIAARASKSSFERVMTYARRLPPEFSVLVVRDSIRKDREVTSTRAFIDWASKDGAKILL